MEIAELIVELQKSEHPIKNRGRLIDSLTELQSMIGMATVKRAVVDQLLFLLSNIKAKGIDHATDGHVLHTLIYGSPGVGKTQLGSILSKIWTSLGILGKGQGDAVADGLSSKLLRDNIALTLTNKSAAERTERAATAAEATMIKGKDMRTRIFAMRTKLKRRPVATTHEDMARKIEDMNGDIQRLSRISSDALNYCSMTCQALADRATIIIPLVIRPAAPVVSDDEDCCDIGCNAGTTKLVPPPEPASVTPPRMLQLISSVINSSVSEQQQSFKAVSRSNFVAEYLGQTATKTKKLLDENRGGVLLVDEAYSLYQGDRDSFGSEALTVINQYMTENADSTVLIFAGYKDLLQSSVFKVQPGLARRFAFTFEIPGYSYQELTEIFLLQLRADAWDVLTEESELLLAFFKQQYDYFPSFGGDTKRLIFQSKLVHSSYNWVSGGNGRFITLKIIEEAFQSYKVHQPLDIKKLRLLEAQRTYDEEVLLRKIKEHTEQKPYEELFEQFRSHEREQMSQRIKESKERVESDGLFDRYRDFERQQMKQRLKEHEERNKHLDLYDEYRNVEIATMRERISESEEKVKNKPLYDEMRAMETDELQQKVDKGKEKKKFDSREAPYGMYT